MFTRHFTPADPFDWDAARYETVEACASVHCNSQWLTNLISGTPSTYELSADEIVERVSKRKFVFKFRTLFHLALIKRLSVVVPLASARKFSRAVVDSDNLWPADMLPGGPARYLVIAPASGLAKILIADQDAQGLEAAVASVGADPREPRIVLNATEVFDQVVEALDVLEVAGEIVGD
jgi:hypothetical protein